LPPQRSLRLGASSSPAVFRRRRRWLLIDKLRAAIPQSLERSNPWSSAVACSAAGSLHITRYERLLPHAQQLMHSVKRFSAQVALVSSCGVEAVLEALFEIGSGRAVRGMAEEPASGLKVRKLSNPRPFHSSADGRPHCGQFGEDRCTFVRIVFGRFRIGPQVCQLSGSFSAHRARKLR
jgi:hypothetical protein